MSLSTKDAVSAVFRQAIRKDLQKVLRTGDDWDRYVAITSEATQRIKAEEAAHARDFPQRLAEAKQMILREENGIRLEHPLPTWAEKHSDADALDRKAGERVRADYGHRIAVITKDELDAFRDLSAEIRARNAPTSRHEYQLTRSYNRNGPTQT
ncbi:MULTISPECIES: hypothetical protein [Paracoccaceae]|uniref:hypothetical protein n=1 Tax=Paracoccaceae TaxID=31989 RepID=UPI003299AF6F